MTYFKQHRTEILSVFLIITVTAGLGYLQQAWQTNVGFIIYRYVENIAAGLGFHYGGEQAVLLSSVSPPHVVLLATLNRAISDLVLVSNIVSIVMLAIAALALYFIVHPVGPLAALSSALMFLLFPVGWFTLGTDGMLWIGLGLCAVCFQRASWNLPAAAALALAILVRPEAALLIAALLAEALTTRWRFRPAPLIVFGVVLGVGFFAGVVLFALGGPLPVFNGVPGPVASPAELLASIQTLSYLWLIVPLLALVGLVSLLQFDLKQRWSLVLAGWGILHAITLWVLPTPLGVFSLLPIYMALCALAGLGIAWIAGVFAPDPAEKSPLKRGINPIHAAMLVLPLALTAAAGMQSWWVVIAADAAALAAIQPEPPDRDAVAAGQWINQNTPADAQIAVATLGPLTYFARRPILDYQGRLQPGLADAYNRRDGAWWLGQYTPAYVVLSAEELDQLGTYQPAEDPWFNATYGTAATFGDYRVYQQLAAPDPLMDLVVGVVEFPDGHTLTGQIGMDFSLDPLEPDVLGRVELNWLLDEPINAEQHVAIRIQRRGEADAVVAINGRDIDFSKWSQRRFYNTYHTVEVSPVLQPGVYDVDVGIGPDPFDLQWQTITQAKVPFPEANVIGGFSGTRAEFGDIILLGYRLARPEADQLDISLNWQAAERPRVDYQVLVQVRAEDGTILAQLETEPHGGAYPTSVWADGERVPDVYTLDISAIPAGDYNIYAGLVDPAGERLLTLAGEEAIFVGRVNITE